MSDSLLSTFYPHHPYGVVGPGLVALDPSIVAAGTTQQTATQLVSAYNIVVTVAGGTGGVILPKIPCAEMIVANRDTGNNSLRVFPWFGGQIEQGGTNMPLVVTAGSTVTLISPDGLQWTHIA